jgi:hypothetical protein
VAAQASSLCRLRNCSNGVCMLFVANSVVIGNGDYTDQVLNCTADTKILVVSQFELFSVRPLCSLCLCGEQSVIKIHHRDTKNTEVTQRKLKLGQYQY